MKETKLGDGRVLVESIMTYVVMETTCRLENGRVILGYRSTEYFPDVHSKAITRDNVSVGFDDGTPMTKRDLARFL